MSQWWEQPDKPDTESPSVVINQPEPMQFWETETDPLPALDMPIPQEPVVEDLPFDEAMSRAATSQPEPVAAAVPAAPEPAGATPEPMPAAPMALSAVRYRRCVPCAGSGWVDALCRRSCG